MNILGKLQGVLGLFSLVSSTPKLMAVLNVEELGKKAVPILIENKKEIINVSIPTEFAKFGDKISIITALIQEIQNKEVYPSLKNFDSTIFLQFKSHSFKNVKVKSFLERKMEKEIKDYSASFYKSLLPEIFSVEEKKEVTKKEVTKRRDFSKSLLYPPFAELVKYYPENEEYNFELSKTEERVKKGIEYGIDNFILLQGFPGTGKTTAAHLWAMKLGLPYRESVGMFDNNDQLVGCFAVDVVGGKEVVAFVPGGLLECYEYGGMYILNEANYTRADVMSVIQGMTDGSKTLHEKTSKRLIKRHDNFVLVFTINPRAKGSLPLNEALVNRFTSVIDYGKASPKEIVAKLEKNCPDENIGLLKELAALPSIVESWGENMGSNGFCSIRQLISFLRSLRNYKKPSYEDFLEEAKNRILTPVCSCNIFNLVKIESLMSTSGFNEIFHPLYENFFIKEEIDETQKQVKNILFKKEFSEKKDEAISIEKVLEEVLEEGTKE